MKRLVELWMRWNLAGKARYRVPWGPDAPAPAVTPKPAAELINPKEMEKREVET